MAVATGGLTAPTETASGARLVTAYKGTLGAGAAAADAALDGALSAALGNGEFAGKLGETLTVPAGGALDAARVILLGLGDRARLDTFRLHNAFVFGGRELRKRRVRRALLALDADIAEALGVSAATLARLAVTATLVANFDAGVSKSEAGAKPHLENVTVSGLEGDAIDEAVAEAQVLAEATRRVQHWANLPSNQLTPTLLAQQVRDLCAATSLHVEVLDREALEEAGAGALLGIAQGSQEPPAMIVVRHDGDPSSNRRLALVGKGITFDTGGISIKPSLGMEMMKFDLGGGAAVLSALLAIERLHVRANVVAIVPATENMPGGRALKPGDVVTAMDGQTIEVVNTDAEGRVVLADGLSLARQLGATHIVDVATLTGAAIIALGHVATGLMSNDRDLVALLHEAAHEAGDRFAELPLHPEYDVCLRSEVADLRNWGGREAGTIAGAVFIRAFAGDLPWAHLDIAGTAWNDQGNLDEVPKGATGAPVRSLVLLARHFAGR
ncbi:MAG: leucyl aminopeptidase [Candidatus Dormibacteria bacterium]